MAAAASQKDVSLDQTANKGKSKSWIKNQVDRLSSSFKKKGEEEEGQPIVYEPEQETF